MAETCPSDSVKLKKFPCLPPALVLVVVKAVLLLLFPWSLLSKLKCPAPSDLSRKRKVKSNPPKGLKRGKGMIATEPSIPPSTRVKEFPNEHLSVVSKKLFCQACRESVSVKKVYCSNTSNLLSMVVARISGGS